MSGAMDRARGSSGHAVHAIKKSNTCLKTHLSELNRAVDLVSYNGSDCLKSVDPLTHRDRWMKIRRIK